MAATPNSNPNIFQAAKNKYFHYPKSSSDYLDLTGALIGLRGYYCSVRTATMRVLLNLNAQCSPFYPAINMSLLMERQSRWDERSWEGLEVFINKLRVKTRYMKTEDGRLDERVKTVAGLSHRFEDRTNQKTGNIQTYGNAKGDHGNARQLSFKCSDCPEDGLITIEKYFLKSKPMKILMATSLLLTIEHGVILKRPENWVLNCGTWREARFEELSRTHPFRRNFSKPSLDSA